MSTAITSGTRERDSLVADPVSIQHPFPTFAPHVDAHSTARMKSTCTCRCTEARRLRVLFAETVDLVPVPTLFSMLRVATALDAEVKTMRETRSINSLPPRGRCTSTSLQCWNIKDMEMKELLIFLTIASRATKLFAI